MKLTADRMLDIITYEKAIWSVMTVSHAICREFVDERQGATAGIKLLIGFFC